MTICESLYRDVCRDCDENRLRKEGNYKNCGNYVEMIIPLVISIGKNENGHNLSLDLTRHLTTE